jgi:hypothetical protein
MSLPLTFEEIPMAKTVKTAVPAPAEAVPVVEAVPAPVPAEAAPAHAADPGNAALLARSIP